MSRQVGERTREGVGVSVPRIDGIPKVKGQFAYGSDLWADEMLWGHTLRSPHPSARIRSIGIAEAVASPGVYGVLLADDVPGSRFYGLEFKDQPVLASDVVRYVGEPVALVAAEHPELARRAAEKIVVDYEPLPAVVDMRQALEPDAPQVHPFGNVLHEVRVEHGDPNAEAEVWVEGYYETGMQDQAPLGPEAGMAVPAEDGGIDLFVATQWLHIDRKQLAPCLGLPEDKVRLFLAGTGGAFGAREDVSMQIHACMLALHTGRPVKMAYGRAESFVGHVHRHPSRIWMRTGATRGGDLVNVRARILIDGGAYTSSSIAVISNATTFAPGSLRDPERADRGHVRLHEQPAVRRDARVRRGAGVFRARGTDGQARRGALDGPGRAPAPQRRRDRHDPAHGAGDPRRGTRARGDRTLRGDRDAVRGAQPVPAIRSSSRAAWPATSGAARVFGAAWGSRWGTRTTRTAVGSTTRRRRASRSRPDPRGPSPRSIAPQPKWGKGSTRSSRRSRGRCSGSSA